jgi:hypothetical protein
MCNFFLQHQSLWGGKVRRRGCAECEVRKGWEEGVVNGATQGFQHTSAYVSIRQHTSAYVIREWGHSRIPACVRIRQHTSAYVSIRHTWMGPLKDSSIRPHTSAFVSIRHTSYVSIRHKALLRDLVIGLPLVRLIVFLFCSTPALFKRMSHILNVWMCSYEWVSKCTILMQSFEFCFIRHTRLWLSISRIAWAEWVNVQHEIERERDTFLPNLPLTRISGIAWAAWVNMQQDIEIERERRSSPRVRNPM